MSTVYSQAMDKMEPWAVLAMLSILIVRRTSHSFDRQNRILLYGLADFSVGISLHVVAIRWPAMLAATKTNKVVGRINQIQHTGLEQAIDGAPLLGSRHPSRP